jgi:hypothetical protein
MALSRSALALAAWGAAFLSAAGCHDANDVTGPGPSATPTPRVSIATPTPVAGAPTPTSGPPTPVATPTPAAVQTIVVGVRAWDFSPGGPVSPPLVLQVGVTYSLVFRDVDSPGTPNPQHGFSGVSELGLPATDDISAGHDFVIPAFTPLPYQRGTYPFACTRSSCGGDPEQHAGMIGSLVIQ